MIAGVDATERDHNAQSPIRSCAIEQFVGAGDKLQVRLRL